MPVASVSGLGYLLQGVRLIASPGLRRFVVVPLLVNVLVFAGAIWRGVTWFGGFVAWMEARVPSWLQWLEWLLWPLFVLTLLVLVFYGFGLVANLIAAPFNAVLAEKVELHLTGRHLDEGGGLAKAMRELVPTLIDEVGKVLYSLAWAIPFLILFLIPGVNLAAPVLWFLYTAWMLALQYVDYPMGNMAAPPSAPRPAPVAVARPVSLISAQPGRARTATMGRNRSLRMGILLRITRRAGRAGRRRAGMGQRRWRSAPRPRPPGLPRIAGSRATR
jgi:CysZ protein